MEQPNGNAPLDTRDDVLSEDTTEPPNLFASGVFGNLDFNFGGDAMVLDDNDDILGGIGDNFFDADFGLAPFEGGPVARPALPVAFAAPPIAARIAAPLVVALPLVDAPRPAGGGVGGLLGRRDGEAHITNGMKYDRIVEGDILIIVGTGKIPPSARTRAGTDRVRNGPKCVLYLCPDLDLGSHYNPFHMSIMGTNDVIKFYACPNHLKCSSPKSCKVRDVDSDSDGERWLRFLVEEIFTRPLRAGLIDGNGGPGPGGDGDNNGNGGNNNNDDDGGRRGGRGGGGGGRPNRKKRSRKEEALTGTVMKCVKHLEQGTHPTESELKKWKSMGEGDIAYWTRKLVEFEQFYAGEVVALVHTVDGLRVTKSPDKSIPEEKIMWTVVADQLGLNGPKPLVQGNPEGIVNFSNAVLVVYMGHVSVCVTGQVKSGDVLCSSGLGNGFAVTVTEENRGVHRRLGKALTDVDDSRVIALVWIMQGSDPKLAALPNDVKVLSVRVEGIDVRVSTTAGEVKAIVSRMDALERTVYDMKERFSAMEKKVDVMAHSNSLSLSDEDLSYILLYCQDFCKCVDSPFVAESERGAREMLEVCESRYRSMVEWQKMLEVRVSPIGKDALAKAIVKVKEDIKQWEEVVVMHEVRQKCVERYSGYKLEFITGSVPFDSDSASAFPRRSLLLLSSSSFAQSKGKGNWQVEVEAMDVAGKRNMIKGKSGMGKSTLCRQICHEWAQEELWTDVFDVVIHVTSADLAAVLRARKDKPIVGWVNIVADVWFGGDMDKATLFWKWCARASSKVLWVFDGYDEVEHAIQEGYPWLKQFFDGVKEEKAIRSFLCFTRPEVDRDFKWRQYVCYEVNEYSDHDTRSFVEAYFGYGGLFDGSNEEKDTTVQEVLNLLYHNDSLRKDARTPMILEFVCLAATEMVQDKMTVVLPVKSGVYQLAEVYRTVVDRLVKRVGDWFRPSQFLEKRMEALSRATLAKVAFESAKNGSLTVSLEDEDERGADFVRRSGLLFEHRNAVYSWKHFSIRDYLAAEWMYVKVSSIDEIVGLLMGQGGQGQQHVHLKCSDDVATFVCMIAAGELEGRKGVNQRTVDIVTALLKAKFFSSRKDCNVAIAKCIKEDKSEFLRKIAMEVWINRIDAEGWMESVSSVGDRDMVEFFIDTVKMAPEGALLEACLGDHMALVMWLLFEKKANPSACIDDVALIGSSEYVQLLLNYGADPSGIFILAAGEDKLEFVKLALKSGKVKMEKVVEALREIWDEEGMEEGTMEEALLDHILSSASSSVWLTDRVVGLCRRCLSLWSHDKTKAAIVKKIRIVLGIVSDEPLSDGGEGDDDVRSKALMNLFGPRNP